VTGVNQVLAARAAILARASGVNNHAAAVGGTTTPAALGFSALFDRAVGKAAASASSASAATLAYERGETDDLAQVMLARQVASIEFEATLQLRNRLLAAYRDIMNMPV
jgi:flagellar hook-basal body complex protein FliE